MADVTLQPGEFLFLRLISGPESDPLRVSNILGSVIAQNGAGYQLPDEPLRLSNILASVISQDGVGYVVQSPAQPLRASNLLASIIAQDGTGYTVQAPPASEDLLISGLGVEVIQSAAEAIPADMRLSGIGVEVIQTAEQVIPADMRLSGIGVEVIQTAAEAIPAALQLSGVGIEVIQTAEQSTSITPEALFTESDFNLGGTGTGGAEGSDWATSTIFFDEDNTIFDTAPGTLAAGTYRIYISAKSPLATDQVTFQIGSSSAEIKMAVLDSVNDWPSGGENIQSSQQWVEFSNQNGTYPFVWGGGDLVELGLSATHGGTYTLAGIAFVQQ